MAKKTELFTEGDEPLIASYVVLDNLDHNGTRYVAGDDIELLELESCVLLAQGVIAVKSE